MVFLQSGKEEKTSPFQKIIDKSQGYECCYVQKGRGKVLKTHGKGQADQRGWFLNIEILIKKCMATKYGLTE